MATIDTEATARRLARAIVSDIQLYNADAVRSGADLSAPVAEGRALYRSRVEAEHYPRFEEALVELGLATSPSAPARAAAPRAAGGGEGSEHSAREAAPRGVPAGFYADDRPATPPARGLPARTLLAAVFVIVTTGIALWLLR